jgi:hypothetical protein
VAVPHSILTRGRASQPCDCTAPQINIQHDCSIPHNRHVSSLYIVIQAALTAEQSDARAALGPGAPLSLNKLALPLHVSPSHMQFAASHRI